MVAESQSDRLVFKSLEIFFEVFGRKGWLSIEREYTICKLIFKIVSVLSGLVLINFQGSFSAKYLFPNLAKSIK